LPFPPSASPAPPSSNGYIGAYTSSGSSNSVVDLFLYLYLKCVIIVQPPTPKRT
jgi:hypothetical protein